MILNTIWFVLIGILFAGYAILDGFDLGVGILHLFTHTDEERRLFLNAIGPVWDGNEVWLVTGGGALFAAFPPVYATFFSTFYLELMLLLAVLIFRAIAIEFRSKQPMRWWRQFWDICFSASSLLISFIIGVALGDIIHGIALNAHAQFSGPWYTLFHPYALLMGVFTVALFTMHGSIYLVLKTTGDLHHKVRQWIKNTIIFFILLYSIVTIATLLYIPWMSHRIQSHAELFILPIMTILLIANIPRSVSLGKDFQAFLSSCGSMLTLMILFGLGMFPNMIISNPLPQYSLTIFNSSSTPHTLKIMLIIVAIGFPLVLFYTVGIYWIFRGKVKLDSNSY
jgi:cytochrome d ubiquinol oxidase subunit II